MSRAVILDSAGMVHVLRPGRAVTDCGLLTTAARAVTYQQTLVFSLPLCWSCDPLPILNPYVEHRSGPRRGRVRP